MDIKEILNEVKSHNAPDVHILVGMPPVVRLTNGDVYISETLSSLTLDDVNVCISQVLNASGLERFKNGEDVDFSYTLDEATRFRVNLYNEKNGPALAFRLIPTSLPSASELMIPQSVLNLSGLTKGLVLVTGPTGSGKSTTMALLVDKINSERKGHIITIEDPIEFYHKSKMSVVTQREVGTHSKSFAGALKSALRQDPNVVMVGEMRDLETMMAALTLAETGHLVISTLHTQDAPKTITRIVDSFPASQQKQIMTQLALTLKAIVSQTLLQRADGNSRVCAYEILLNSDGVASCIKDGKIAQIYSMMQIGKSEGMRLLDEDLARLCNEGVITAEVAMSKTRDVEFFKTLLK